MHFIHHLMATQSPKPLPWFKRWRYAHRMNLNNLCKATLLVGGGEMGLERRSLHSRAGCTALCCLPLWPLCIRPCVCGRPAGSVMSKRPVWVAVGWVPCVRGSDGVEMWDLNAPCWEVHSWQNSEPMNDHNFITSWSLKKAFLYAYAYYK